MRILCHLSRVFAFGLTLSIHCIGSAQSDSSLQLMMGEALSQRENLTAEILKGDKKPAQALTQLRASASSSGLKVDHDADFALAAIDMGQRLLAAEKPALAEEFFREAEQALEKAVQKTKDSAAQEKALFLQQLAFIRANFLNKTEAAQDDIDAAIRLQPDDKHLKASRDNQGRDKAEHLKNKNKS